MLVCICWTRFNIVYVKKRFSYVNENNKKYMFHHGFWSSSKHLSRKCHTIIIDACCVCANNKKKENSERFIFILRDWMVFWWQKIYGSWRICYMAIEKGYSLIENHLRLWMDIRKRPLQQWIIIYGMFVCLLLLYFKANIKVCRFSYNF